MIICGWCGKPTKPDRCENCQHVDPARPWLQRGQEPPTVRTDAAGRPGLDHRSVRRRLATARRELETEGRTPTVEALAERLSVSTRTVRRWREMSA